MTTPDWLTDYAWERLQIDGILVPGTAVVQVNAPDGLETKKAKKRKGGTLDDNGDPPMEFNVTLYLKHSHMPVFERDILPILRPDGASKGRGKHVVAHPLVQMFKCAFVVFGAIKTGSPVTGFLVFEFRMVQWAPQTAKKKVTKSDAHAADRASWEKFRSNPEQFESEEQGMSLPEVVVSS